MKQSHEQVSRLTTIWVDGGFDGEPFMQWVMDFCRWIVQVVLAYSLLSDDTPLTQTYQSARQHKRYNPHYFVG
ncbi:hypothetical protein [Fortiea sp. LEGE XX443]|uniref:hypothetical protein n=1 Tax=Fortiea sp. LEGE XX443 TaxID=1828611 RepID=UPI001D14D4BB|nr:hypothetical protein [Fortiea sp. LEGE XX443]